MNNFCNNLGEALFISNCIAAFHKWNLFVRKGKFQRPSRSKSKIFATVTTRFLFTQKIPHMKLTYLWLLCLKRQFFMLQCTPMIVEEFSFIQHKGSWKLDWLNSNIRLDRCRWYARNILFGGYGDKFCFFFFPSFFWS